MNKIFILGLPRTGTTSLCELFLHHNYKVAHTAFTQAAFEQADVIADTPVFSDFYELDALFPNSQWIYLHRNVDQWLPSIQIMLNKLKTQRKERFHPLILRSFERVFGPLENPEIINPDHLKTCYNLHQEKINTLQKRLKKSVVQVELVDKNDTQSDIKTSFKILTEHLNSGKNQQNLLTLATTPLNENGKITAWQKIKHPDKVSSHLSKDGRRNYFEYRIET